MRKKKKNPSKSDFIRSQPSAMSAAAIVAKAKERGIKIDSMLVYKVRGRERAKAAKGAPNTKSKTGRKSVAKKTMSKAAFIRSLPSSMPAKAVIARAVEQGMKLSANHVYAVRSTSNPKAKARAGRVPKAPAPNARHGARADHGFRARIEAAAASFTSSVLAAIRSATLDELISTSR